MMLQRGLFHQVLAPGARYYLMASTFFVVVFGIVPVSLYAGSGEDWGFPFHYMLKIAALGAALCLAAWLLIRLLALLGNRPASALACVLFCLGLFALLAHVYAPIQIGPLDGLEIASDEPVLYSALEAGLALVALAVLVQLLRGRWVTVAAVFSGLLLLVGAGWGGALLLSHEGHARKVQAATAAVPDITGNVYHLVLDSMRTDVFLKALERTGLAPEFAGFELFRNNVSNYVTTVPSSASYFTGTFYRGGRWKTWIEQWYRKGILASVGKRGYRVWMYAPFPYWHTRHVDRFWYNFDILEQEEGIVADVGFHGLIQIWLASLAPNPLTNEALPAAGALRDRIFHLLTGAEKPLTVPELHPVAGVSMLRRLLREEALRGASGQYVYAHAALPHTPFVFEPDCRYAGQPKARPQRPAEDPYLQQAQCTIRLVADFLADLRARGRYDQATVIVHADTGLGIGKVGKGPPPPGKSTLGVPDRALRSGIQALLMIKRPQTEGPLQISEVPTQLVDLFPTVLDILDLEPGYPVDGRSIYTLAPGAPRDVRFGLDPSRKYGHEFVEVRIEDPTNLARSPLTVVGPATDPRTWPDGAGPEQ
jgi:hypothetical protein